MSAPTIHATTVAFARDGGWRAVLLTGRSGSGKSDLALRLIDRGAMLVSDDYTDLRAEDGRLLATPPPRIAGRIEVRGLGLVSVPHLAEAAVALVAVLDATPERMPDPAVATLAGIAVPRIALRPFEASAPIKLERALDLGGVA
ncbi:MAG: HPr kinase/phosphatase C-terminal domain-containing protein [Sphingomonas sp.]